VPKSYGTLKCENIIQINTERCEQMKFLTYFPYLLFFTLEIEAFSKQLIHCRKTNGAFFLIYKSYQTIIYNLNYLFSLFIYCFYRILLFRIILALFRKRPFLHFFRKRHSAGWKTNFSTYSPQQKNFGPLKLHKYKYLN
jgi:hypothetical protein